MPNDTTEKQSAKSWMWMWQMTMTCFLQQTKVVRKLGVGWWKEGTELQNTETYRTRVKTTRKPI